MAIEIERKFLVNGDGWRGLHVRKERLRDGLVAATDDRKVRVRIYGESERATLTVKARKDGLENAEYEYDIPLADAEELLSAHCGGSVLTKTRYYVPYRGFLWEIDVYDGLLKGVVLADVELASEETEVELPPWIGQEVTGRPEYKKINMLAARRRQLAVSGG